MLGRLNRSLYSLHQRAVDCVFYSLQSGIELHSLSIADDGEDRAVNRSLSKTDDSSANEDRKLAECSIKLSYYDPNII